MKIAIVQIPGLNRDRDMIMAVKKITGKFPILVWQSDTNIPDVDLIIIPGGFSYGDYLRCGAIAARTPVMQVVKKRAQQGVKILGICNGFQILVELNLLPGILMRNTSLKFICKQVLIEVVNANTAFTQSYKMNQIVKFPIAHHDGNYFIDSQGLAEIESNNQVVFRYASGRNPNGSLHDIAGITNRQGNVLGMMPHPENMIEEIHGGIDGRALFTSLLN
ncbi:Phosphoribosylformylglycinamidine synthase subunit PurQ [Candidatus Liberibacter solanacearum]|uniref:Phosphoribosylformylglycinamidine synthase subunit PurQ n=2 Tax=Candidatus Liberibacter solanacearum TaxID=556287 RepID=A0A1V2N6S6_9HYPH|nr:phosphoribosylformylglycinamidine synthase subunit PurQ [Candidatus Liberibacter solanacearum]ADR52612.1 phosphoribosylformylglycinamidine synthase I [Candidatus Liberibacter solanacearum CLso-ZC1]ONI58400.1 phosphoribosylformylglycinamidine synthase I [Candidatus Liberibacter solanacearum]ONI59058.1 phosphoribosylformylglycinamidine synthase I [Candidatus Liberibacter solanacearum]RPD37062.1 phosphoribosylformylglycinamidine synthase subunit PurQ [Candidatus Liberibacter solanacearum]